MKTRQSGSRRNNAPENAWKRSGRGGRRAVVLAVLASLSLMGAVARGDDAQAIVPPDAAAQQNAGATSAPGTTSNVTSEAASQPSSAPAVNTPIVTAAPANAPEAPARVAQTIDPTRSTATPPAGSPPGAPPPFPPLRPVAPATAPAPIAAVPIPAEIFYSINAVAISYDQPMVKMPAIDDLMKTVIVLGKNDLGYTSIWAPKPDGSAVPRPGVQNVKIKLADIAGLADHRLSASAIQTIGQQLSEELDKRGAIGAYVASDTKGLTQAPAPGEAPASAPAATTADDHTTLKLVIHNGAAEHDGPAYRISGFVVQYSRELAGLPSVEFLAGQRVELGQITQGSDTYYVSPETADIHGNSVARIDLTGKVASKISEAGALPSHLYRNSGLLEVEERVVKAVNDAGIGGIYVEADKKELDAAVAAAKDPSIAAAPMHLTIHVATAALVRTIETGPYTHSGDKADNPADTYIKAGSPIQATGDKRLLKTVDLDEYVLRLNRQPGRHVDVAVAAGEDVDTVSLDYLITEANPWLAFFQLSNTGTAQTAAWRERFGVTAHQLTGHEDNLTIDYTTAGFAESHTLMTSYDFPIVGSSVVRGRVYADYSAFTASDVGVGAQQFNGDSTEAGAELIGNVFQRRALFVDLVGGTKYQHLRVDNSTTGDKGSGDYLIPYLGVRVEQSTQTSSLMANLTMLGNLSFTSETSQDHLGRLDADGSFPYVRGDFDWSFFLEPLLSPGEYKTGRGTLAHEIGISARGQYAFNNRFVAEQEDVAGGLYSVRGYPESIVSGDSVIIGTAEYRFHLPRVFPVQRDPATVFGQPFRTAPQQPYGHPDWDLIFRGFVDAAQTINSQIEPFEEDATLVGTGVGMELVFKHNMSLRADWGVALTPISAKATGGTEVEAGSSRFHIVLTFSY